MVFPLAVIDPFTWTVIGLWIGCLAVAVITAAMIFDYAREARLRNRNAAYSQIIKRGANVNDEELVDVIDLSNSGQVLDSKTFKGKELDSELKRMAGITTVYH